MSVYLRKERKYATGDVTAKHGTVLQLVRRVENKDHKLHMDSYFSSPRLLRSAQQKDWFLWCSPPQQKGHASKFRSKTIESEKRRRCIQGD
jgi:hypothetical protein